MGWGEREGGREGGIERWKKVETTRRLNIRELILYTITIRLACYSRCMQRAEGLAEEGGVGREGGRGRRGLMTSIKARHPLHGEHNPPHAMHASSMLISR